MATEKEKRYEAMLDRVYGLEEDYEPYYPDEEEGEYYYNGEQYYCYTGEEDNENDWHTGQEDDWTDIINAAHAPEVYYKTGAWTSASHAKAFWDEFKKNGFKYNAPPVTNTGDEAIDRLAAAGRNIIAKYLAYATKKSTDDPNGPFDYDDYILWEADYNDDKKSE